MTTDFRSAQTTEILNRLYATEVTYMARVLRGDDERLAKEVRDLSVAYRTRSLELGGF